ncbi:RNA-directed DNA polymerase (reverse transcriptase)-related family protein [Rhynchospora pubera]|uniref:RNA-directed DNA polymerase (Reverse transcriptase)-related family protein n=1 Tax=Rhynchospora pubera TaxID=906938 RepID=A0AAV8F4D0_9POAL|nr:RNA-directed DNA polymerase (reverse transcriptase)-related family protein [Rhynchospora pubera]
MKVLANRLRPYMQKIISVEQTAFISGRCITDSVLLVKEILHSFKSSRFNKQAFMLKADITKAFDKLDWEFLRYAMLTLNVPTKIVDLMLYSFKNAKVTIQINGTGDGFIKPTRGLRQGCPMSPYCFIMVMEMLTRKLKQAQSMGHIQGVKLAQTCPILTHVIYADDLILLGNATGDEVQQMSNIMENFANVSGLMINPVKSKLWFSKKCSDQAMQSVKDGLRADLAGQEERYLGVILAHSNSAKKTGNLLLEKLKAKLSGWRSNMLSHAGRLVLIKSVLMSVPVYFMSAELLPKGLIRQMDSLIAKFFWGKSDQARYMSFVAWAKICRSTDIGGLGVRNLNLFGEALFLKLVWDLMSNGNKMWVHVCKSKYYSNLGFWRANNVVGASSLWRHAVKMRDFFKENVKWQIASGENIPVLSQPWYQQWKTTTLATRQDRKKTVAEVFEFEAEMWNSEELVRMLGGQAHQFITNNVQKPVRVTGFKDKLIWSHTKSGEYLVKEGYECLVKANLPQLIEVQWKYTWEWKNIAPKIRIFLWRLLSNGLPLAQNMHHRIQAISPMCMRCREENEFATHCFFFCQGSKMVWFGGNLGIRTENLPLNIGEAVEYITHGMSEENVRSFCYTLWEIWLARNEVLFQNKRFDPRAVCAKARASMHTVNPEHREISSPQDNGYTMTYEFGAQDYQVIVDASWDTSHMAGVAYLIYQGGRLIKLGMKKHTVQDPFHAEAMAVQEAINEIQQLLLQDDNHRRVQFYSDCLNLVVALEEECMDNLPSWRARPLIVGIINQLNSLRGRILLQHVNREAVKPAHDMANQARRCGSSYNGLPMASLMCELGIGMRLDPKFFQQVLERPP